MKFQVSWTQEASKQFVEIVNYCKRGNKIAAKDIFKNIKYETNELKHFPKKGRVVPELKEYQVLNYRELIYKVWHIIYKIEQQHVQIISVIDSRRDFESIFLDKILNK